jgi:hypothetical protein
MAVTDYKFPGTAANVDRGSKPPWINPNNAKADDTSYAECTDGSGGSIKNTYSDWLLLTNFGFTSSDIPSGSTIDGIEFEIGRWASEQNLINDSALYLYDDGQVGNNLASATKWPTTMGTATYGGATNMCGTSLTQADIVATTFGVWLSIACGASESAAGEVDYIKIRVYYTEGGGSPVKPHYYYLQQ